MKNHNRLLYNVLIILLFKQIISQNFEEIANDFLLCMGSEYNNCTNVKLNSGVYQCCNKIFKTYYMEIPQCAVQTIPISTYKEQIENEATKALSKEMFGYSAYKDKFSLNIELLKSKVEYNCKDGNLTILYGYDTYTDDEIKVFQSGNHCLKYMYERNFSNTQEVCFNSVLTQNAKDVGLTCGFFEFNIKYIDNTVDNIKTCNIFNKEVANYGNIDEKTKDSFTTIVNSKNVQKVVLSYTVEFSDESGYTLVYDSTKAKVSSTDNSEFTIKFSKIFLIPYYFIIIIKYFNNMILKTFY